MRRMVFDDLPAETRAAVEQHAIRAMRSSRISRSSHGNFHPKLGSHHAPLVGSLALADNKYVFIKAAPLSDDAESSSLRNEAAIVPYVQPWAPELLFTVEAGGWIVTGFESITGNHADYTDPQHLSWLAEAVHGLSEVECPDVVKLRVEDRWPEPPREAAIRFDSVKWAEARGWKPDPKPAWADHFNTGSGLGAGKGLLHTDLNPSNVLVHFHRREPRVRLVDWAFASRGRRWVESALLGPWLLMAGHSPAGAARWVQRFPDFAEADEREIEKFTGILAAKWTPRAVDGAAEWILRYAWATARWHNAWRHSETIEP